jgi:hypothetical protein
VPAGCVITDATVVGLTMTCPERLEPGALVDFDLILGARPIATMARVIACAEDPSASGRHRVDLGFVAMAQVDRDTLADFLQAVGRDVLRVREPRR